MQPNNTPLSNTKDAAMFQALAKEVSAIGGLEIGGRQLAGDKLWEALQKAWRAYPADKIARSYVHHAKVAAAVYACKDSDDASVLASGGCVGRTMATSSQTRRTALTSPLSPPAT